MGITPEQLNEVIPKISPKDFSVIIPKLTPETLTRILPKLTPEQFNSIIPKLTPDQINTVLPKLTSEELTAVIQATKITPESILDYIQDVPTPEQPGPVPIPIPPGIIKPLLDFHLRQNKAETAKQGIQLYDVKLQYQSSSEQYKIKSNSFQGAASEALSRRQTQQIPTNIIITQIKKQ